MSGKRKSKSKGKKKSNSAKSPTAVPIASHEAPSLPVAQPVAQADAKRVAQPGVTPVPRIAAGPATTSLKDKQHLGPKVTLDYAGNTIADFTSNAAFPTFPNLPSVDGIDMSYYTDREDYSRIVYGPSRHWVLLANIDGVALEPRLVLRVHDRDGNKFGVVFVPCPKDPMPPGFDWSVFQVGSTLAVNYALAHRFSSGIISVRVDMMRFVRVFPIQLNRFLALNAEVRRNAFDSHGKQTCHGCGKRKSEMKRCQACEFYGYCNKTCQVNGWKVKGHKHGCRFLQDVDLRGMMRLRYDKFEEFWTPPTWYLRSI